MLLRPHDGGQCKRKCWEMSVSTAGFGLKYQKQMGVRAMGAWGAWVTGAFTFQTESGSGSNFSYIDPHHMAWGSSGFILQIIDYDFFRKLN